MNTLSDTDGPPLAFVHGKLDSLDATLLVDGGSGASLVKKDVIDRLNKKHDAKRTVRLRGVSGKLLATLGHVTLDVKMGKKTIPGVKFIVTTEPLPADVLVGRDAMHLHKIRDQIDHVTVEGEEVPLVSRASEECLSMVLPAGTTLEPQTSKIFDVDMKGRVKEGQDYMTEGCLSGEQRNLPLTLAPLCQTVQQGIVKIEITNHGEKEIKLDQECVVATATRVEPEMMNSEKTAVLAVLKEMFVPNKDEVEEAQKALDVQGIEKKTNKGKQEKKRPDEKRNPMAKEDKRRSAALEKVLQNKDLAQLKRIGNLTQEGEEELAKILHEYQDRFQMSDEFLREPANVPPLKVVLKPDAKPCFQKPYLLPGEKKDVAREYLFKLRDNKVIKPAVGPWGSPLILIEKKDKSYRACIDLRKANSCVQPMYSNMPHVEYVLGSQLNKDNAKVLSALDLSSCYFQIPLDDPEGVLNISSHLGSWSWNRVPMGFVSSAAYVQSIMLTLLSDIIDVSAVVLLDDILLHTSDERQHLNLLKLVLERLKRMNFSLKANKCELLVSEVDYLGFKIDGRNARLHLQEEKISKVKNWPRPTTIREVRSFVAFSSFLRRFIKGFADLAKPLNELTKLKNGNVTDHWDDECEKSFRALKMAITTSPTLKLPDVNKKFVVFTDASEKALGFCIMQRHKTENGKSALAPVAYGSRLVTPTEGRYTIAELEALGVSFALTKSRYLLTHRDFVVLTDSAAVKWSLQADANRRSKRLERFLLQIQDVVPSSGRLDIRHVKGKDNPSDALSRTDFGPNSPTDQAHVDQVAEVRSVLAVLRSADKADGRLHAIRKAQEQDPDIKKLRKDVMKRDVFRRGLRLAIRDGVVVALKPNEKGHRYLLPRDFAKELVRERHFDSLESHPSQGELQEYLSERFVIPNLSDLTKLVVEACDVCQRTRLSKRHYVAELTSLPRASEPMKCLSLDVAGPFLGYGTAEKYILVLQDNFSRYAWTKTVAAQTGKAITSFLMEVFDQFGCPQTLLSDRGTNLRYGLTPALTEALGVRKVETTAYHPASNGMVERLIGTIGRALKRMVLAEKQASKWPELLRIATQAYNRRKHSSTGFAPAEILMAYVPETGREPVPARVPITQPHREFMKEKMRRRKEILEQVDKNLREVEKARKETFDRTRARPHDFHVGQWVLVRVGAKTGGKLRVPYIGPARIDEITKNTAKITYISNGVVEKINVERIKEYLTQEPLQVKNYTGPKRQMGTVIQEEDDIEEGLQDDNIMNEPEVTFA